MAVETDRIRIVVENKDGDIIHRDLPVMQPPRIVKLLSGASTITFPVHPKDPALKGINFKAWGTWLHAERLINGERKIIASGILKPGAEPDPATGLTTLEAQGFSAYPKGLPWLQNWNPITVDVGEVFERIWNHIQSQPHGNLGVQVYPTTTGAIMLPGFSFDNEELIIDFFALFIREVDEVDCGDFLEKLARDIPIDYFEESEWNEDKTGIVKKIHIAYPKGGVEQTDLIFRMGENVIAAKPKTEVDIQWTSDVSIKGWFPNKQYSYRLSNADPDRYRRVIKEADARINSNERAAAWARRKLARRQIPHYWEEITIDPYHPNAPFGEWDVGDTIRVEGQMPWKGHVSQDHRIIGWDLDSASNKCVIKLMAEGAFNYDPIDFPEPA